MRPLMPLLAFALVFTATSTASAAKHCWCEISAGCPKDGGRTVHDFGALARYRDLDRGKQRDCAARCADASSALAGALQADPDALCERLGPGTHELFAYSKVGHTDTRNNWCDPDDYIGRLRCETECVCPPGYTYDAGAGHCAGHCNGLFVMTRPDACDTRGRWVEDDPCGGDIDPGPGPGEWSGEVVGVDGERVWLDDVFGDLEYDGLPAELPVASEGDAPPMCGVDACE